MAEALRRTGQAFRGGNSWISTRFPKGDILHCFVNTEPSSTAEEHQGCECSSPISSEACRSLRDEGEVNSCLFPGKPSLVLIIPVIHGPPVLTEALDKDLVW